MPTPLYASPFPSLDLTIADKEMLLQTADDLLDQVEHKFEAFLWQDKGAIDPAQWDLVREREDVRVYHDSHQRADVGGKKVHQLLTTGTIPSTLTDTMYGELNHTTEAMRIKTAYVEDTLFNGAVLETILEPTADDPFQSTTVRWFVKSIPLLARAVSKHADCVLLESTGVRQLSNGEKIGFRLMHSVVFEKTSPLPAYQRVNISSCALWREVGPKTVQLFMATYLEIEDSIMTPLLIKSMAEALIAVWKVTQSTHRKKLAWLLEHRSTLSRLAEVSAQKTCSVCRSKRATRKDIKSACAVCSRRVCRVCRVKRELCLPTPGGQLIKHEARFCVHCVAVANKLDPTVIARDEALGRTEGRSRNWPECTAAIGEAMGVSLETSKLIEEYTSPEDSGAYSARVSSTSPVSLHTSSLHRDVR